MSLRKLSEAVRRLPPTVIDIAVTVLVLAAHTAPFLLTTRTLDPAQGWTVAQYLPVVAQALPLLWRRTAPIAALVVVLAATAAYNWHDPDTARQPVPYALLVVLYTVAAHGRRRQRTIAASVMAAAAGAQLLGVLLEPPELETVARGVVLLLAAWAMGRSTAHRQAHARDLERRRELEAEQAVATERATIARDMHDILGHAISVMVVQAEAGPVAVRSRPDRAEAAFDAIAEAGRDAMSQIRQLLGLLKETPNERLTPPSVTDIAALVERVDSAGLAARLIVTGVARTVARDVGIAAYRVVQEALTNAVKHAEATMVTVEMQWNREHLMITVVDDGVGRQGSIETPGHGHGLVGIAERARACGGTASFGPGADGRGFAVDVELPVAAT